MYFHCEYCSDYVSDSDDFVECDCGSQWCSIRCAKYDGYVDKKSSSSCDFCRQDNDYEP
jgi:hypothetical protein